MKERWLDISINYSGTRRAYRFSQKKLAELLGVDQTTLAGWERGEHRPIRKNFKKLFSFIDSTYSSS
jgi:transcriptional regulator with XRE-family HTH domain